jgi:RimJ/RimL family protein N-acetyltransferase
MALIPPISLSLPNHRVCIIRPIEWSDAQGVNDHRLRAWEESNDTAVTNPIEQPCTLAERVESIEKFRADPNALWLAALVDHLYIGGLSFKAHPIRRLAHHGHFGIGLDKPFWNLGIGNALIRALIDWATPHPTIEKLCLGVFATNHRAIALYTKLGFTQDSRRLAEFKLEDGSYIDDIQMSLWLKPKPSSLKSEV